MPPTRSKRVDDLFSRIANRQQFVGQSASSLLPQFTKSGQRVKLDPTQLSGNFSQIRGGSGIVNPSDLDFGVGEFQGVGDLKIRSFQDLVFSNQQQKQIANLRRTAAARGLRGGAVNTQLDQLGTQFLAENRAVGFRNVSNAATQGLARLRGIASPFLQQAGAIQTAFESGAGSRVAALGSGNLRQLAQPLFRALVGLGKQNALTAGLLLGENVDAGQFNLSSGDAQIARAVQQFLNPSVSNEQRARISSDIQRRDRIARSFGGGFNRRVVERGKEQFGLREVAASRVQAASFLSNVIQQPLRQFQRAQSFISGSQLPISVFLNNRLSGGAQRLRDLDLNQFKSAFSTARGGFNINAGQFGNFGRTRARF